MFSHFHLTQARSALFTLMATALTLGVAVSPSFGQDQQNSTRTNATGRSVPLEKKLDAATGASRSSAPARVLPKAVSAAAPATKSGPVATPTTPGQRQNQPPGKALPKAGPAVAQPSSGLPTVYDPSRPPAKSSAQKDDKKKLPTAVPVKKTPVAQPSG